MGKQGANGVSRVCGKGRESQNPFTIYVWESFACEDGRNCVEKFTPLALGSIGNYFKKNAMVGVAPTVTCKLTDRLTPLYRIYFSNQCSQNGTFEPRRVSRRSAVCVANACTRHRSTQFTGHTRGAEESRARIAGN
jgi:hypothetical protein